jgi:cytochrome bd-type quinol oxidase subunit 2
MEEPSTTQIPSTQSLTLPQPPPVIAPEYMRPPGSIKVFGVIHLVFAAYGVCTGIFGILSTLFMGKIMNMTQMGSQAAPAEVAKLTSMMDDLKPYQLIQAGFTIILAVMLLLAGLSLLKMRDKGRVQSNAYAWTSIVFKLIYLAINIAIIIPLTKAMTLGDMPPEAGEFGNSINLMMTIMPIISILATLTYPIVALIMLNTRAVRNFLAGR